MSLVPGPVLWGQRGRRKALGCEGSEWLEQVCSGISRGEVRVKTAEELQMEEGQLWAQPGDKGGLGKRHGGAHSGP